MIKLFVGLIAVCVRAAFGPMRLASGVLLWLVFPTMRLFPHCALRSPSELKDGRDYLFGKVKRRFFADPIRAAAHPRGAFTLAADSGTGTPGIRCWQKHYPDGSPCGEGVGCWSSLNCHFGHRRHEWHTGIRRA